MGITDHAQHEMGEIVMVELPGVGGKASRGQALGALEAVKTAEDFYSPMDGEVVEVNTELDGNPALVNEDPYGAGWLVAIRADNPRSSRIFSLRTSTAASPASRKPR